MGVDKSGCDETTRPNVDHAGERWMRNGPADGDDLPFFGQHLAVRNPLAGTGPDHVGFDDQCPLSRRLEHAMSPDIDPLDMRGSRQRIACQHNQVSVLAHGETSDAIVYAKDFGRHTSDCPQRVLWIETRDGCIRGGQSQIPSDG